MTVFNKLADRNLQDLGSFVEAQFNLISNPLVPTPAAVCLATYRQLTQGRELLQQVAKVEGVPVTSWHATLQALVTSSEARGSNAAAAIKTTLAKSQQIDALCANLPRRGLGDILRLNWHRVRLAKQHYSNHP